MSTVQINRNLQPEPVAILVESKPVKDGEKPSNIVNLGTNPGINWEDLMGLPLIMDREDAI